QSSQVLLHLVRFIQVERSDVAVAMELLDLVRAEREAERPGVRPGVHPSPLCRSQKGTSETVKQAFAWSGYRCTDLCQIYIPAVPLRRRATARSLRPDNGNSIGPHGRPGKRPTRNSPYGTSSC